MDTPAENFADHNTNTLPDSSIPEIKEEIEDDSGVGGGEQNWPESQIKKENGDDSGAGGGEERWPGWPGENVFRLLVPVQKVGGIIGRKGEFIKKMCEETKARIKILDGPHGTLERAVMVSAKEEPDSSLPPAIEGLLRVHKRIVDGLDSDPTHAPNNGTTSSRLLMAASQAGNLIGKHGSTIKSIQEASNCNVRVLGEEFLPVFALEDDRVVEIEGEPTAVHKALELTAIHLRKFLVDRSVIGLFEMQMQNPNPHMEQNIPQQSWGPPQGFPQNAGGGYPQNAGGGYPQRAGGGYPPNAGGGYPPNAGGGYPQNAGGGYLQNAGGGYLQNAGGGYPQNAGSGPGFGPNPHYMPPQPQHDNYYPPAEMPPVEKPPHQGLSMYGRDASRGGHSSTNSQPPPSIVTQGPHYMQIPLSYADAVIGNSGANISYTRRASGATITIQETRGVPGEMTVEINGTASEVQAAKQLIQNFMAEAAGAQQTQANGPSDNTYAAHTSVYSSPPSNTGHAGQPSGYGNNYGANNYNANYGY